MRSRLVITTAADDLQLLTIAELRQAAGVTGSDSDTQLYAMGLEIAAQIATECNIAVGSGGEPTLRKERLTETFWNVSTTQLVLSRRHRVSVISVDEDGVSIAGSDSDFDAESGIGSRFYSDRPGAWRSPKITVVYEAGFTLSQIPRDLKSVAMEMTKAAWASSKSSVASGVKRQIVRVDDIDEVTTEYFEGTSSSSSGSAGSAVPESVAGKLARFRNISIV